MALNIETTAIPGTITLVDPEHTLSTRHLDKGDKDIVLVPSPSSDANDPLNWSPRRKLLSTVCVSSYTLFVGIASSVVYSVLVPLSEETGISVATLNQGTGYLLTKVRWGLLFWQPIALQYGKRPVYLISVLGVLAMTIWGPYGLTQSQWIARNIIFGLFCAPIEALPEISVTDVYFTHERGLYMSIYSLFLAGSNFFAPVICGFIAQFQGWRWVFYYPSMFLGGCFIFLFLFMEETNYERKTVGIIPQTDNEVSKSASSTALQGDNEKYQTHILEKHPAEVPGNIDLGHGKIITNKEKTFWQKMAIMPIKKEKNIVVTCVWHALYFTSWPVVFYAGFSYGSYLIWFNVLNGTASIILGGPPYNFDTSIVGLSYVACCLGVIGGTLFTGRFSDWLTIRLARRNNGIMEAEHRLWPFLLCVFWVPAALLLWGVGAAHEVHWFGLIFAMWMLSFCNTTGITISVNYLIDSYRELSGEVLITTIIVRNTMSFAIGYGITPWINSMGYQNCIVSAAFIGMACCVLFLIMIVFGKGFRVRSKEKYWALVVENLEIGMGH
ncbi:major facilitator superfamily domain-containing protein [Lipomyces kononenkoae]